MITLKKDRILGKQATSKSKIALPEAMEQSGTKLEVVAVGPEVTEAKVGDIIYVDDFSVKIFPYNDENYFLTRNENVIGNE